MKQKEFQMLVAQNQFDILESTAVNRPELKDKIHVFLPEHIFDGLTKVVNTRINQETFLSKRNISKELKEKINKLDVIVKGNAKIKTLAAVDLEEKSPIWPRNKRQEHELYYKMNDTEIVFPNKGKAFLWTIHRAGFDGRPTQTFPIISYNIHDEKYVLDLLGLAHDVGLSLEIGLKTVVVIMGEDFCINGEYSWTDAILPNHVIKSFKDDLEFWINNEHFYEERNIPYKRGYLLEGPPGNGKTLISRIVMCNYDFACYSFDFSNPRMGDSDLIRGFNLAANNAPSIVLMEDIDRIFEKKTCQVSKEGIMNCLDGVAISRGVVTIATSNNPKVLDPAIRMRPGRFDVPVKLDNPDFKQRIRYLKKMIKEFSELKTDTIDQIVEKTNGKSMAYMKLIVETAGSVAFKEGETKLNDEHLLSACNSVSKYYESSETSNERKAGFSTKKDNRNKDIIEMIKHGEWVEDQTEKTAMPRLDDDGETGFSFNPNEEYFDV